MERREVRIQPFGREDGLLGQSLGSQEETEKGTLGNWSFPSSIHLLEPFAQTCFSSDLGTHSNRNPDKYLLTPPPQRPAGPLPAGQLQSVTRVAPFLPEDGEAAGAWQGEESGGRGPSWCGGGWEGKPKSFAFQPALPLACGRSRWHSPAGVLISDGVTGRTQA